MALIAAIGILIAFVILAVEIVVTIIEFHIVTLVAFVTVPFGVLTQTSFMSERAIGYVVSVGIKLMALAIVVSLGTTVFDNYTVSPDPGIGEDVGLLLAAVVMVMLALKIPVDRRRPDQRRPAAQRRRRGDGRGGRRGRRRRRAPGHARARRRGRGRLGGRRRPGRRRAQRGRRHSPPAASRAPAARPRRRRRRRRSRCPADFARAPVSSTVPTLRSAGGAPVGGGAGETRVRATILHLRRRRPRRSRAPRPGAGGVGDLAARRAAAAAAQQRGGRARA